MPVTGKGRTAAQLQRRRRKPAPPPARLGSVRGVFYLDALCLTAARTSWGQEDAAAADAE